MVRTKTGILSSVFGIGGTDLSGLDLSNEYFAGRVMDYCDLRESNLTDANFEGTYMRGVDVRGAKFTTELSRAKTLFQVLCDDDQLSWLILHPDFCRKIV